MSTRRRAINVREVHYELTLTAVRFDGGLRITDPTTFHRTVEHGVGSGKGLGFGLLSVHP